MKKSRLYVICSICGEEFKSLGIMSHRAACYRKWKKKDDNFGTHYQEEQK